MKNGIFINGHKINILFRCCICDSPARSFVKGSYLISKKNITSNFLIVGLCIEGTVNFNHKNGCQKFLVVGEYSRHRMSFPRYDDVLRTDTMFRNRSQPQHHKTYSLLETLEINMIDDFPTSDTLHLIELGVTKRLL